MIQNTSFSKEKKFLKSLNPSNAPIVAEVANTHCGSLKKIMKLINIVLQSDTSIIKFQIFKTYERAEKKNKKDWSIFSKLEFNEIQWRKIVKYCKKKKLFIIAEIYGEESLEFAKSLKVNAYKIHSEDSLNKSLIIKTLETLKPTLISIGGLKRLEILNLIKDVNKYKKNIVLMTGTQSFPTPVLSHSIFEISDLIKKFNFKIGFADHVEGDTFMSECIPFMAVSAGACLIEKHFTLSRKERCVDYHSSLSSKNFIKFSNNFNKFKKILLTNLKSFNYDEKKYRKIFKKNPVSKCSLGKGKKVQLKDIIFKKIRTSRNIINVNKINKNKLIKSLKTNTIISNKYFKNKNGIIIVARNFSERLKNKAFLEICNHKTIEIVINRAKKIKNVDHIILATSTHSSDDLFKKIANNNGIDLFRGSSHHVADRFYQCAKKYKLDNIIRITGDSLLVDYEMLNIALEKHLDNNNDVTFIKNLPFGTAKEIFSFETIKAIAKKITKENNSEYLEFFLQNERYFNIGYIKAKYKFDKKTRLTLDYKEDYILLKKIFNNFSKKNCTTVTIPHVLKFLKYNKNLLKINSHKIQKNPFNQNLDLSLNF
jgi:spore coat polysaccharide biosynthesis protein SpsF (cytidylyltransferase family)/sialic acid synthase SpsE